MRSFPSCLIFPLMPLLPGEEISFYAFYSSKWLEKPDCTFPCISNIVNICNNICFGFVFFVVYILQRQDA